MGAHLGLTPARYQSGETDISGKVSRCYGASHGVAQDAPRGKDDATRAVSGPLRRSAPPPGLQRREQALGRRHPRSGRFCCRSERLNLYLAELDDAFVLYDAGRELQGDGAIRELRILDAVGGFLAVEHDGDARPFCRDLVGVPLARRLRQ